MKNKLLLIFLCLSISNRTFAFETVIFEDMRSYYEKIDSLLFGFDEKDKSIIYEYIVELNPGYSKSDIINNKKIIKITLPNIREIRNYISEKERVMTFNDASEKIKKVEFEVGISTGPIKVIDENNLINNSLRLGISPFINYKKNKTYKKLIYLYGFQIEGLTLRSKDNMIIKNKRLFNIDYYWNVGKLLHSPPFSYEFRIEGMVSRSNMISINNNVIDNENIYYMPIGYLGKLKYFFNNKIHFNIMYKYLVSYLSFNAPVGGFLDLLKKHLIEINIINYHQSKKSTGITFRYISQNYNLDKFLNKHKKYIISMNFYY